MGWMAELAGKTPHKGQVVVTNKGGVSTTYVDIAKAEDACVGLKGRLKYFRGAFFEQGSSRRADAAAASTKAAPEPMEESKPAKRSRRRDLEPEGTDGV